jgi:hypothetical protein
VGTSFEQRLDKVRNGKRARRPVELIGRGSPFWFGLAAVLLSASQVVAIHRIITGMRTWERRIVVASLAPAILFTAIFAFVGWLVQDVA